MVLREKASEITRYHPKAMKARLPLMKKLKILFQLFVFIFSVNIVIMDSILMTSIHTFVIVVNAIKIDG